jgi:hypothetical protein
MRRAKRAVWVLAALVVLVLAGCTSPNSSTDTSTTSPAEATASAPATPPTAQKFDTLDELVGYWKVTYTLASVKPASMRRTASDNTPKKWNCIVYNGEMRLTAGARAYTGQIAMTGKDGGKGWNYKGQANYASGAGEAWTSDIVIDGKMLSADSFSAKETGTVTSSIKGRVFTATWKVKGERVPDPS